MPRTTCPPPPPGQWIAAGSDADGSFDFDGEDADLVLVRTDGARRRRLTAARGNDFSPSWSPSGDEIVFRTNRDRADALDINDELYAICADGSRERRLTNTPDVQERSPAASPDGRLVAFAAETRDHILDGLAAAPLSVSVRRAGPATACKGSWSFRAVPRESRETSAYRSFCCSRGTALTPYQP